MSIEQILANQGILRKFYGHPYFWRTARPQEADYLEEYEEGLHVYEFK